MRKAILQETANNNNVLITKNINNWIIIITSWLISMTLIISWVLWIIFFKNNTKELLILIDKIITKNGIKFNLNFPILTIIVLGFGFVILGTVTVPFIFFKKNDFISLILIRVMILISLSLIIGSILFIIFGYYAFYDYVANKNFTDILFFIIPWTLEIIYSMILTFFSTFFIKKNRQQKYLSSEIKQLSLQDKINQKHLSTTNIDPFPVITTFNNDFQEMIWTPEQIEEVWNKGKIIDNFNPKLYRKDYAGSLMFRHNYLSQPKLNDEIESFNWTIVYEQPIAAGGNNYIKNLVPMNNNNAITKGNNFPRWTTTVTYNSKKNKNIFKKNHENIKKKIIKFKRGCLEICVSLFCKD